jgi:hypothetical protein
MVTTTVRMVDGVHSNTTSLGPRVTLDLVLVVSTTGLQEGLVDTTTTSNDTNSSTGSGGDDLLGTRGETETGLTIFTVTNDSSIVTGGTGQSTTITNLFFDVAHNGTFGDGGQGQDITNVQGSLLTAVEELTSVHTFGGNESFSAELVPKGAKQ